MREDTRREASGSEFGSRSSIQSTPTLARLAKLDGYTIAEGDPDIRGWDVKAPDGWTLGEVEDLVVDTSAMPARYLIVRIGKDPLARDPDRRLFVPLGTARLDDIEDTVVIERVPINGFTGFLSSRDYLTIDDEAALRRAYGYDEPGPSNAALYGQALYDERRFWQGRRQRGDDVPYIVRSAKG